MSNTRALPQQAACVFFSPCHPSNLRLPIPNGSLLYQPLYPYTRSPLPTLSRSKLVTVSMNSLCSRFLAPAAAAEALLPRPPSRGIFVPIATRFPSKNASVEQHDTGGGGRRNTCHSIDVELLALPFPCLFTPSEATALSAEVLSLAACIRVRNARMQSMKLSVRSFSKSATPSTPRRDGRRGTDKMFETKAARRGVIAPRAVVNSAGGVRSAPEEVGVIVPTASSACHIHTKKRSCRHVESKTVRKMKGHVAHIGSTQTNRASSEARWRYRGMRA